MAQEMEVDGRTLTNIFDVGTAFARELRFVAPHPNTIEFLGCTEGVALVIEAIDSKKLGMVIE